jgi:hypothetical protein
MRGQEPATKQPKSRDADALHPDVFNETTVQVVSWSTPGRPSSASSRSSRPFERHEPVYSTRRPNRQSARPDGRVTYRMVVSVLPSTARVRETEREVPAANPGR